MFPTDLKLVLVLLVDSGEQLGLAAVQGLDKGVALRHQTGLELHAVLLEEKRENFYSDHQKGKTVFFSDVSL